MLADHPQNKFSFDQPNFWLSVPSKIDWASKFAEISKQTCLYRLVCQSSSYMSFFMLRAPPINSDAEA